MSTSLSLNFSLHAKQGLVLQSPATEILYGGAASGGKSHLSRVLALLWCLEIPGIQIYFFRRVYEDLVKNHVEGPNGFRMMLAPWINAKHPRSPMIGGRLAEVVEGEIRFWNGSKIFLCHCQHEKDLVKYYGPEFHVLFIEEATQFTEYQIRFLRSRLRIPDALKIPEKYKGLFPRAIYTSNPGGVGHRYMKEAFITGKKPMDVFRAPVDDGNHLRQFIPAKVDDNPSVDREAVKANLRGLPPNLVDAILNGNWNAVVGAYFEGLSLATHGIPPFQIPEWWPRIMSFDWGSCGEADPFSLGWWAISDGSVSKYPRGAAIRYREWYGRGLPKQVVKDIAAGIKEREFKDPPILYRVAGRDIFDKENGPSIADDFKTYDIHFRPADTRRIAGWQQMQNWLRGKGDKPDLYCFDTYTDWFETISSLQHDPHDPNDVMAGEDHQADDTRYFVMSRAYPKDAPTPEANKFLPPSKQMNKLWEEYEASKW